MIIMAVAQNDTIDLVHIMLDRGQIRQRLPPLPVSKSQVAAGVCIRQAKPCSPHA